MILKSANIQRTDLYLVSFYGAPMKPSELFCFKDTKNVVALLFFSAACNRKFQQANAQP